METDDELNCRGHVRPQRKTQVSSTQGRAGVGLGTDLGDILGMSQQSPRVWTMSDPGRKRRKRNSY